MKKTAVTIAVNGAEYLELDAGRIASGAKSMAQYIRLRCGLSAAVVANAAAQTAPRGASVRLALERRTITIPVNDEEWQALEDARIAAGVFSMPQYIRTRLGFTVRETSMPKTEDRDREEDEAWERLRRLGLEPEKYFEDEEGGVDAEKDARDAMITLYRAMVHAELYKLWGAEETWTIHWQRELIPLVDAWLFEKLSVEDAVSRIQEMARRRIV